MQLGEADAGIVYVTDVTPDVESDISTIEIPDDVNVIAVYPIAVTSEADEPAWRRRSSTSCCPTEGQAILQDFGFLAGRMTAAMSTRASATQRLGLDWLFLPAAVLFVAFLSIPLVALAWRALDSGELAENLTSDLVLDAMRLSAITSTFTLMIAIILGTPLAYLLARRDFPGKAFIDVLIDLPIVLPPTVAGVALLVALGRRGVLGQWLDDMGIQVAFTTTAVVLAQLFVSAPFYVRTVKAGFEAVEPVYEGVAWTLGASPWRSSGASCCRSRGRRLSRARSSAGRAR